MSAQKTRTLLDSDQIARTLARIGSEIVERHPDLSSVHLVGIRSRGVPLAERIRDRIKDTTGVEVPVGAVDISFYRDDVGLRPGGDERIGEHPVVGETVFDAPVEGATIVLVDDVLYTGRTVRAAIDAVFDYGRPACVQLAVLADRGHRELPFRADFVGKNLPTQAEERVRVRLMETDGVDEVVLIGGEGDGA
ncbi:MAG: bifunctional pyr operon transcriptional regulator/uracil phosphoribosyltransferase PyrR [Gaiellales bacterium]